MARVRSKTRTEIWKIQRRYNNKINRMKRSTKKDLIPRKISNEVILDVLNNGSARDVKRQIAFMNRFLKRDATKIVTYEGNRMIKSDKENIISLRRSAINRITNDIKFEIVHEGMVYSYDKLIEFPELIPLVGGNINNKFTKIKNIKNMRHMDTRSQIDRLMNYSMDRNKAKAFKENVIQMLVDNSNLYGRNFREYHELVDKIKNMSVEDFIKYYRDYQTLDMLILSYKVGMEFSVDWLLGKSEYVDEFNGIFEQLQVDLRNEIWNEKG